MKKFVTRLCSIAPRLVRAVISIFSLFALSNAYAISVTSSEATRIARAWAQRGTMLGARIGSQVERISSLTTTNGVPFFAVKMSGGGTIFMAGDDESSPILAFTSSTNDFSKLDPKSPLAAILNADLDPRRRAAAHHERWQRLRTALASSANGGKSSVDDLRVAALVESKWSQDEEQDGACYNLYTPKNYVCGCVATAMSQLMRYHCWPLTAQAKFTKTCTVAEHWNYGGTQTNLTSSGAAYQWDDMTLVPKTSTLSDVNRQAIGTLTFDAGISVEMKYTSEGSGAYSKDIAPALMENFGYASATYYYSGEITEEAGIVGKTILCNLDAKCPVLLGIANNSNEGHSIVADGYGYSDSVLYVHLNMGWSGQDDLWYNLPNIGTAYNFSIIDDVTYNVFPTIESTKSILSGRILDSYSNAVANAEVTITLSGSGEIVTNVTTDSSGIYAAFLSAGTYDVSATIEETNDLERTGIVIKVSGDTPGNVWGIDMQSGVEPEPEPEPEPTVEIFVDADSTVENPDGSIEKPYPTISEALAVASAGAIVRVAPGTYAESVVVPNDKLTIISTEGPDVTFIDGQSAWSCYIGSYNPDTLLAGFTLENGVYSGNGGGVYYGTISNCVIRDCMAYDGGGAYCATLIHCTVYGNVAYRYEEGHFHQGGNGGGVAGECYVQDSIVWENYSYNSSTKSETINNWAAESSWRYVYKPTFTYSCTTPSGYLGGTGCIDSDPCWVDSDNNDIRLKHTSPCLGTASDGTNMGAWQGEGIRGYTLKASVDELHGCGEVSPTSIFVLEGESATFTASTHHPLVGFETNGVFASDQPIFTWENVQTDGEIIVRYTPTNFYVNGTTGDDTNDGWTPETAKRSLHETTVLCGGEDQVLVMPGVYTNFVSWGYHTIVRALEGPSVTIIDGEGKNQCFEDHWYPNYDGEDCTTLIGFTLRNGYSEYGGGARYGTLVDCVISNCAAIYGGGASEATLTNCLVVGNRANYAGGGVYECQLFNCTVANNSAAGYGGGAYLHETGYAINTIVATNTSDWGYDYGNDVYGKAYYTMIASLSDVDAKFVDAANGNWRLMPQSPAVNAGSNSYVSTALDLDGKTRIFGTNVDIGCFEYGWPVPQVDPSATPEEEHLAVSQAMEESGFPSETAAAITTQADYAKLTTWAEKNGISSADHAKSQTAIISPALDANSLLQLTSNDVQISAIEISTNASASCVLTLDMPLSKYYNAATADLSLLKAAIGVVGANSITNEFTSEDLNLTVEKGDTAVKITVEPPDSKTYFLKTKVR